MKEARGNRIHIGIYGRRNAGKSTLINELTGQQIAIVSDTPGTTADPVYKSMELRPVGPVVFIDTAGYDDQGKLGALRVEKTEQTLTKADIAVLVIYGEENENDKKWRQKLEDRDIPYVIFDSRCLSADGKGKTESIESLREEIAKLIPEDYMREKIIGDLVGEGDLVLLVMPQDASAPKGRLILPQVQTLRELLDRNCTTVSTTADGLKNALAALAREPDLIVTDSQCFSQVYAAKPAASALTSFSILFAAYKGDIDKFITGAEAMKELLMEKQDSSGDSNRHPNEAKPIKILIAEACTHVPASEDIGTVKIPNALRKYCNKRGAVAPLEITNIRGNDFPPLDELTKYDLVIHCGACMFNRKHVLNRIAECEAAKVPITNYGIALAELSGILYKVKIR